MARVSGPSHGAPPPDPVAATAPPAVSEVAGKWWIFLTIAAGTLLGAFNNSSLNAVLPVIRDDFGTTVGVVQWAVMAFLLVNSSLLLTMGRLGDLLGHKLIYLIGLGLFTAGIGLAIVAPTFLWLLGARVLQAIGAAMLVSAAPAISTLAFPPHQRGRVLGFQATTVYVGLALGPAVGGLITDQFGWRAIFFVCLPLAALTAGLALRYIPAFRPHQRDGTFDLVGAGLFMGGMSALLLALSQGKEWGWVALPTLGLLGLAVVGLASFVAWESRYPSPMLDLRLFRIRLFSLAVVSSVLNFLCFYSIFFLLPFYLIAGRGWTAGEAGLVFLPLPLTMAVVVTVSGWASDRIGSRGLASAGMGVLTVGLLALGFLGATSSPLIIALTLMITGVGIGLFTAPNNSTIMGSVPVRRRGVASGVVATARSTGMVLGIAVSGAIFTSLLGLLGTTIDAGGPAFYTALNWTFRALAGVALLAVITSYSRGNAMLPAETPVQPAAAAR